MLDASADRHYMEQTSQGRQSRTMMNITASSPIITWRMLERRFWTDQRSRFHLLLLPL